MPDAPPPADAAAPPADGGLLGSLAAWGSSAWSAASAAASEAANSARSLLGLEDLAVVDPPASGETTGAAAAPGGEHDERRAAAFADWARYVGADITSLVSLPVWIMEPYTLLQKVAEIMEYSTALKTAAETEDEFERMAWVAGFCLGPFGGNERTWKPFNPILGETFQVDLGPDGGRFLAEQVSHHPPIGAARAEGPGWSYDIVSAPATRFLGNAVDIFPRGRTRIRLPGRGEAYSLAPPNSKAHNLIVGRTWVDCYGDFKLTNLATGAVCELAFTPCGWFGAGRYAVAGHIADSSGGRRLAVSGAWNSHLDVTRCDPETGEPVPGAGKTRVWQCAPKPTGDPFGFTHFARKLCDGAGLDPLPTDSRRRPDRAALEAGDQRAAGAHKHALEEAQRAERRAREKKAGEGGGGGGGGSPTAWAPRWFRAVDPDVARAAGDLHANDADPADCPLFEFVGDLDAALAEGSGQGEGGGSDDAGTCVGRGFKPWQFPELHTSLADYEAKPPLPPPAE